MPRNDGIASGESMGRKPGGWDEADVGAVGDDAPEGPRADDSGWTVAESRQRGRRKDKPVKPDFVEANHRVVKREETKVEPSVAIPLPTKVEKESAKGRNTRERPSRRQATADRQLRLPRRRGLLRQRRAGVCPAR